MVMYMRKLGKLTVSRVIAVMDDKQLSGNITWACHSGNITASAVKQKGSSS
jgi:hypothetical protein